MRTLHLGGGESLAASFRGNPMLEFRNSISEAIDAARDLARQLGRDTQVVQVSSGGAVTHHATYAVMTGEHLTKIPGRFFGHCFHDTGAFYRASGFWED